jgi:light-regulated signal transduction histidine kinase (bacteriophytochrome)
MSSGYSEEDIRRAAEIREWLIKEISDRQEEIERLRTTLSIIDNLLKQGSFKAAANLGFAAAATSAPAGPTTATAQMQQQAARQTAAQPTAAKKQQQQQAAAPTLRTTADNGISGGDDSRNVKPLKRAKDDFLLANAEISQDAVVIVPAPGVNLNANTPPFKSFFLNRILEGMKNKDAEKVSQGALGETDALNYKVEEDGSGIIKQIVINKYREKDRLQEIFNTSAWVFTRMLEKSGR